MADLAAGSDPSQPVPLAAADGVLYFAASADEAGRELWSYDPSTEEATRVSDIHPGPESSFPSFPVVVDSTLYFSADDGAHGRELWAYPEPVLPPPGLDLTLVDPAGDITLGCSSGSLSIQTSVENVGTAPVSVTVWAVAEQTAGGTFGPNVVRVMPQVTIAAGESRSFSWTQKVPGTKRDRAFDYRIYAGDYHAGSPTAGAGAIDSEVFNVAQTCASGFDASGPDESLAALIASGVESSVRPEAAAVRAEPNPARSHVRFVLGMEGDEPFRLTVYDALGREVAVVAEGLRPSQAPAPTLDVASYPAGVYLWRLASGGSVQTGQFTVVR